MLTMIILGAGMAACGQVGPIDAFRLNFSAVQVQGHYTIRTGRTNYRLISEIEIGEPGSLRFDSSRWPATEGDWACNGAEEKYRFPVQFGGIEGRQDGGEEGLEVLYDGMKLAQRLDDTGVIDARGDGVFDAVYYGAKSPFHLFMMKFPELIGEVFADVIPEVAEMRIGRRSVSVESYVTGRTGAAAGWKRLDIYYDHEWNFIPVYARFTKYSETDDSAKIREHFVLRTHRCPGGGVVPVAWVESQVEIDDFQGSYPEFDAGVEVVSDAEIAAVVFEFECEDLSSDVLSFSEQPLNIVTTPGGPMSAKLMASRENITLEKLSKLAGGRLTTPSSDPLPNIDHDELNMHKGGTSHRSRIVVASGLIIAAGIGASLYALRRRSAGLMALLVIQFGLLGCSAVDEAEIINRTFECDQSKPNSSRSMAS